jgi:RNA polymerase sigma factor (sigma-70 family)
MAKKQPPRPRHPDVDKAWEQHHKLLKYWASKCKRIFGGHVNTYLSELYIKLNNDLWLFDPSRGVKFSTYFSTQILGYLYRIVRLESEAEMATWAGVYSKSKTSFKCKVFSEQCCNIDQQEFKDKRDYYNWVHDMIEEIGGREEAWYWLTFNISARSIDIIHRRFVLGHTLEEIGRHYNVTRERIRQLEFLAMATIKERFGNNAKIEKLIKRYGLKFKD